jgi:hypothetical protein
LGKRSERLFDALAKHWRHVGSMRLIAGPDLATTTIEPHEFLDFLGGKLARRFIDGPDALNQRISEMDLKPDGDGRFRVCDFFCHEDTWQMTLTRLVADSDAVLMDLRGFSQENHGVVYEIEELISVVPLERVVFVIDQTTDEKFDAITSDPLDPWVKGAAMLYTREFFQVVKEHLNPGGVVTLFVQLYESNTEAVKSEIATLAQVFPDTTLWNPD